MKKIKESLIFYSPSIITGFFIGTSYIPFPPWAYLFAFVPLWLFWLKAFESGRSWKVFFLSGWLAQFTLTLIGFNWIAHTAHEFGNFPWYLSGLTLILFCCVANLDLPIVGVLWFILQKKLQLSTRSSIALLAVMTALFETWVPTLFPWNYGYTWLWAKMPIAQTAEIIGFQGISSLVILFNFGFLLFWLNKSKKVFLVTSGLFLALNLAGLILEMTVDKSDSVLNVQITQANIGNMEKVYAEKKWGFREHIVGKYVSLTQSTKNSFQPDIIVWPETAYPYELDQSRWPKDPEPFDNRYPAAAHRLLKLAQDMNSHLITGGYGVSPLDQKATNTFFVFRSDGLIVPEPYYKTILLAFGEYIPGAEHFPQLKKWIPAGDFSRGQGPMVKELPLNEDSIKIGSQICYESLFPGFSRKLADLGAEVIVNLTNDSWFGTWQEPHQHLYMTLARAIELRRPLVRATNTGLSTVILADGSVLDKSLSEKEWVGTYSVPYKKKPNSTFYQDYPWLMEALLIIMFILIVSERVVFARFKLSRLGRNS